MKVYFIGICLFVGLVLQGSCNSSAAGVADSTYIQQLLLERKEKDNSFAAGANSPFAELNEDFTGLKYFEPNKDWNISGDVIIPHTTYTIEIADSKGGKRYYIYSGTFRFQKGGKKYGVPLFREKVDPKILFVMFRDNTNGNETYGGGRYLEMPWPEKFDHFTLDFNKAFNPYCHYNHSYSCPVVPQDMKLDLEIKAGEKKYK